MGKNILDFSKSKTGLKYYKYYDQIKNSGLFDEDYYRRTYNIKENEDPLTHYLLKGYKLSYNPSLDFDTEFYLNTYDNVKAANINPLYHYMAYGKDEGKIIQKAHCVTRKEEILNTNKVLLNNFNFKEEPLVSIIILNKDGINHLKVLFEDFDKKTNYSNYEIIVVDNASSDDSVNYLKSLDLPIKIIENNVNESFSFANNQGAKIANGEYLLLLNNDIEPTYGWLSEMMAVMLNNENVGAVGSKLVFPFYPDNPEKSFTLQHSGDIFSERMYPCCLYAINKSHKDLDLFDTTLNQTTKSIAVTGAVILVKKDIYDKLGGLDEDYDYGLEDVDFCLKLHKNNYNTFYCGTSLLFHHESSTRVKSKDYVEKDKKNYKVFWNKWGEYLSKNLLLDKIYKNNFFSQKNLKIMIINNDLKNNDSVNQLAKYYVQSGYEVNVIDDFDDLYIGNSTDILISFSNDYDFNNMICRDDLVIILIENNEMSIVNKTELSKMNFDSPLKILDNIVDMLNSSEELWDLKIN